MKNRDESLNRLALKFPGVSVLSECVVKFRFQSDVISRLKRPANQLHVSRHSGTGDTLAVDHVKHANLHAVCDI